MLMYRTFWKAYKCLQCRLKPRQVCGPGPCPIVAGPKECRDDIKTVSYNNQNNLSIK